LKAKRRLSLCRLNRFFLFLGTCAVPKPRARDLVSGLSYPLALAGSLTRAFPSGRKATYVETYPSVFYGYLPAAAYV
jgi:hypothetical protein